MLVSKCSITVACNQLFIKVHKQTYHIENTESKKTEKDETKKNIYKKKANHLSTYGGLEGERCYYWEEKTKISRCFFKSTKSLIDRDGSIRTLSKFRTVFKDVTTCFHLKMIIWTLGILCRKKVLSILPNESIVKNSSSCSST